tara:strand:- start:6025 stop:6594 length:570 start_codon:yes stop_codon:yes gene_type:complete
MNIIFKSLNNPLVMMVFLASVWFYTGNFFGLTAALMIFVTLQVIVEKLVNKEVSNLLFTSWCLLIPLGSMTLFFRDPLFLQWKFTIFHWLFGLILLGARIIGKRDILKAMLSLAGPQFQEVEDIVWKRVNFYIAFGFILLGFINLYVMSLNNLDLWVNFKIFGTLIYNFILLLSAGSYLMFKTKSIANN